MRKDRFIIISLFIIINLAFLSDPALAKDYANFESFYKESGFWGLIIGIGVLLAGVAIEFFSGGMATPLVAPLATAIGGMLGFSGTMATSAGLSLLAFGPPLGLILEGTVFVDSQISDMFEREATYQELCNQVKDYPNFPPIKNDSGPSEIGKVVKILDRDYDVQQSNSSDRNQMAIREALYELNKYRPEEDSFYKINYKEVIRHEQLRVFSLLAILYFMENDYKSAYDRAKKALIYFNGVTDDGPPSVPNFIIATAGLITKEVTPDKSADLFIKVVGSESESPILPLLYSIYISRAEAAGAINSAFLKSLVYSVSLIKEKKIKPVIDSQVMIAILTKLWTCKETIATISDNIQSLTDIKKAKERSRENLKEYEATLGLARTFRNSFPSETTDERKVLNETSTSIQKYSEDLANLQQVVAKIERTREGKSGNNTSSEDNGLVFLLIAFSAFIFILHLARKKKKI